MADKANMTYTLVEDRNARTAFSQVSAEITAIKRVLAKLESSLDAPGYGAVSVSAVAADVTFDVREGSDGIILLNMAFPVVFGESSSYDTILVLANGFPKTAVAASVSFLSALPTTAGNVNCTVLPSGNVILGISAGADTFNCVATAVWKRR